MIAGRDSAFPPNDAQLAAFYAQGIRVYGGYIKIGNDGIYNGWSKADFDRVKAHGMRAIAYMSGWVDPAQARAFAAAWGVLGCLDDEGGIRPDGSWVPNWLNVSGFGLYGNGWVHNGRIAAFHVEAGYPTSGNPYDASWNTAYAPRPAGPCGWQWAGSHNENGITVDSSYFDDSFAGLFGAGSGSLKEQDMTNEEHDDTVVFAFRFLQFQTGKVDPKMVATLSDGKTLITSCIDFAAPTLPQLMGVLDGLSKQLVPTIDAVGANPSPLDVSLQQISRGLFNVDGTSKVDAVKAAIPPAQTNAAVLTAITDLSAAVGKMSAGTGAGLTADEVQELADTKAAAIASLAVLTKHFTP